MKRKAEDEIVKEDPLKKRKIKQEQEQELTIQQGQHPQITHVKEEDISEEDDIKLVKKKKKKKPLEGALERFAGLLGDTKFNPFQKRPDQCVVCDKRYKTDTFLTICGHLYCNGCHGQVFVDGSEEESKCSLCNTPLKEYDFVHTTLEDLGVSSRSSENVLKTFSQDPDLFKDWDNYSLFLNTRNNVLYNTIMGEKKTQTEELVKDHVEKCGSYYKTRKKEEELDLLQREYICHEFRRVMSRKEERDNLIENRGYGRIDAAKLAMKGHALEQSYHIDPDKTYEFSMSTTDILQYDRSSEMLHSSNTFKFPEPQVPGTWTNEPKKKDAELSPDQLDLRLKAGGFSINDHSLRNYQAAWNTIKTMFS